MPYLIRLQQFEGPLDLLLRLTEEQKLDITQVSLAQVADQYIEYINQNPDIPPSELADFLVIAAKLLLIKSKELLPILSPEEEEEVSNLEKQLKIYKEYYEASKILNKIILKKNFTFTRKTSLITQKSIFKPPSWLTKEIVAQTFQKILKNLKPIFKIPQETVRKIISLQEKIRQINELILKNSQINFSNLINGLKSKTEIILNFLALLELFKQKIVIIQQKKTFGEITIIKKK